ncbi:phosphoesterase PA-phosphatase [Actinotalea ferrariae CF5-4]|uniref:Phosphoesterase PA-phosphatase n=1 Tax=Actinotalea ferrariae CF5-4 TaxID=948458 RepID=A0A021VRQ6_9CELL|nr:phosphoesterase PA-phosphatase [Actinotalea ferrariae CF5-4]
MAPAPRSTSGRVPPTGTTGALRPGRRAPGLVLAVVSALAVVAVWWAFVTTRTGQLLEQAAFQGSELGATRLWLVAEPVLEIISLPFVALVLLAAMLLAVVRRRVLLAVQVAVLMAGSNLSTQVLKHGVLDRPDLDVGDRLANALPSGHTTAAASVSVALLLVLPPRFRPAAAIVGVVYTCATGISTMVGQWHRPSDVVAAVLVVGAWAGVAAALGVRARPRSARPAHGRWGIRAVVGLLLVGGAVTGAGAFVALQRSLDHLADGQELASRADLLTAYGGGALGVVTAACLVVALVLVVLDVTEPRRVLPS